MSIGRSILPEFTTVPQLCVYLRLNDIPVPALYGPSGDEAT
jgi:hypothetical protein